MNGTTRDRSVLSEPGEPTTFDADTRTLLRDVAVEGRPRVLQRPHHPHHAQRPSAAVQPNATITATVATVAHPAADAPHATPLTEADGYRRGMEQGHRDGLAAGQQEGRALGAQQGYQEGFERGRQEGRAAAEQQVRDERQAASAEIQRGLAVLGRTLDALPAQIAARLSAAEDDMVALCHGIVCRILGERLVTAEGIAHLVHQSLELARGDAVHDTRRTPLAALHLNPRDLHALQSDAAAMAWLAQRLAVTPDAIPLIGDDSVGPGGCFVHSLEGSLDARLDTQMASLAALLTRERAQ